MCSPREYRKFWIQVLGRSIAMGLGDVLGENVIVKHVDKTAASSGNTHAAGADEAAGTGGAAAAAGGGGGATGAEAEGRVTSEDVAMMGIMGAPEPEPLEKGPQSLQYVAFTSWLTPMRFRNIRLGHVPGADPSAEVAPSFDAL